MAESSSTVPSHQKPLVEQLTEDDEERPHHLQTNRDVEQRDVAAREQASHHPEGDEVLEVGAGEHDSADPEQRESRGAERLRDLHRVERAGPAHVQVRAGEVDEQEGGHQDHATLKAPTRGQVTVGDDVEAEYENGGHESRGDALERLAV